MNAFIIDLNENIKKKKKPEKINYDNSIDYFKNINDYLLKSGYSVSIDEIIYLINNNEEFSERIKIIFNSKKNEIFLGPIDLFEDNQFLNDTIATYYMISIYDAKRDIDDFDTEIDNLSKEMKEYYKYVNSFKDLNFADSLLLIQRMKKGDLEAKQELINANLKCVFRLAYKFLPFTNDYSFEDLIQEANETLIKAFNTFDDSKSSNITRYIEKSIMNRLYGIGIANLKYTYKSKENLYKYKMDFIKKNGRKPSVGEIKSFIYSTNNELFRDKGFFVQDPSVNVEDDVLDRIFGEEVREVFNNVDLSDKERDTMELRCGLTDEGHFTLEEVGNRFNITRERVRQIEKTAREKVVYKLKKEGFEEFFAKEKENNCPKKIPAVKSKKFMSLIEKANCFKEIYSILSKNEHVLKIMSLQEAYVLILRSHFINGKIYSYYMISQLLDIDEKEVKELYYIAVKKCMESSHTNNPRKIFKK